MNLAALIDRAAQIAAMRSEADRKAVAGAFSLLFWNEPGFSPSAFLARVEELVKR